MGGKRGIAHIENESGLPGRVAGDFIQQGDARGGAAERAFMIDHFDGFVAGARGEAAGGGEEMGALPEASGAQTLLAIIAVADGDESDQRRAEHQIDVAIFFAVGCGPAQHFWGHHFGGRVG